MFIYKITNLKNNKVYIGQSIRPIEQRFKRHINDAINNIIDTHFARAIRKYGENNFIIELLDVAKTQEELNYKEQYWIKFYNSTDNKIGYNETDALYKCGGNTYKSKTPEEMLNIKNKIRDTKIGSANPNSKEIKCINVDTNEELFFDTVEDCRKYFGESTHRFITTRVLHQTQSLYKGQWNIAYKEENYIVRPQKPNKKGTRILVKNQITLEETTYVSIRLASRQTNISRNKINQHIKNGLTNFVIKHFEFTILD